MSWEDHEVESPCPCGAGKVVRKWRSDDWGRTEGGSTTLQCEACRKSGLIVAERDTGKGIRTYIVHRDKWAAFQEEERLARADSIRRHEEAECQRRAADDDARSRLGDRLVNVVYHISTRKALWEALKVIRFYSEVTTFAAFNRLFREVGRDAAIRRIISSANQRYAEAFIEAGTISTDNTDGRLQKAILHTYNAEMLARNVVRCFGELSAAIDAGDKKATRSAIKEMESLTSSAVECVRSAGCGTLPHRIIDEALAPVATKVASVADIIKKAGWVSLGEHK